LREGEHVRTVLTTGANSGIGLATVIELARRGFRSIGSARSDAKAQVIHDAAAEAGVEVETVLLDVADAGACEQVMADLRLFGLVNNAGYTNTGAVEDVGDDEARDQLETMVVAPMRLARLALPAMRTAGEGRIVNVSSIYGRTSTPLSGWYQASKHALEAVSDALRIEVAGAGIDVVLVEPGAFRTGIWDDMEQSLDTHDGSAFEQAYRRSLRLTRLTEPLMGQPERVAKVISRALRTPFPRARYLVGYDAMALAVADRLTPTTLKDRILRASLGL
jgi:NAD(P)-dependent dehydrogenase (short-subunit alcohol dehydrogenase family)